MSSLANRANPASRLLAAGCVALLFVLCLRRAWLSDDAFITLRVVDNLLEGHGLRYNVEERVQVFTHPLWALLLVPVHALCRDYAATLLLPGVVFTVFAVTVVCRRLLSGAISCAFFALGLALSSSFVDYATSGLENPLSHAILAYLAVQALRPEGPRPFPAALLCALLALCRPDAIVLGLPTLALALRGSGSLRRGEPSNRWAGLRRSLGALSLGLLPLALWGGFSLVYYGTPLPNTAIAKLSHGLPRGEMLGQGVAYVVQQAVFDPWSLLVLVGGGWAATAHGERGERALVLGAGLYLAYVVWIGGDFMLGRFWSAPFFVVLALLARRVNEFGVAVTASLAAIGVLLSLGAEAGTFRAAAVRQKAVGVGDERLAYAELGLSKSFLLRARALPPHKYVASGLKFRAASETRLVSTGGAAGLRGYFAGPKLYFVDMHALTDPFLARLPAVHQVDWRPGHLVRRFPQAYVESRKTRRDALVLPGLRRLYDDVDLVTRAGLWSRRRWQAIWRLSSGRYRRLDEFEFLRRGGPTEYATLDAAGSTKESVKLADGDAFGVVARRPLREVVLSTRGGPAEFTVEVVFANGRTERQKARAVSAKEKLRFEFGATPREVVELHAWVEGEPWLTYRVEQLVAR